MGGQSSERQWRDILGIMKTLGGELDLAYLQKWAAELGVTHLLERAIEETGD